jgi:formylmethanofuran dehydrogenase subunit D
MEFNLITGRTFNQGATMEIGKGTDAYRRAAAVCEMDSVEMDKIGVKAGDTVKVSSSVGEVVVYVAKTTQMLKDGNVFIPMGPWVNSIMEPGDDSTGMPAFKNVMVEIEKVEGAEVLQAFDLMRDVYLKGGE